MPIMYGNFERVNRVSFPAQVQRLNAQQGATASTSISGGASVEISQSQRAGVILSPKPFAATLYLRFSSTSSSPSVTKTRAARSCSTRAIARAPEPPPSSRTYVFF